MLKIIQHISGYFIILSRDIKKGPACPGTFTDHKTFTLNRNQITMNKQLFFSAALSLLFAAGVSAQSQTSPTKVENKKEAPVTKDPSLIKKKGTLNAKVRPQPVNTNTVQQPTEQERIDAMKTPSTVKTTSIQLVNEPGFPPYINTGDKAKDDANYSAAKTKWIQENPERYKQMCGKK
jgi:hypothetical protein